MLFEYDLNGKPFYAGYVVEATGYPGATYVLVWDPYWNEPIRRYVTNWMVLVCPD